MVMSEQALDDYLQGKVYVPGVRKKHGDCAQCDGGLYDGDEVAEIDDVIVHDECADDYLERFVSRRWELGEDDDI